MNLADIIGGLVTGLAGGLFSGFLGVTAGGPEAAASTML